LNQIKTRNHQTKTVKRYLLLTSLVWAALCGEATAAIPSRQFFGLTPAQFNASVTTNVADGYRPICLDANGSTNSPNIAAVWIPARSEIAPYLPISSEHPQVGRAVPREPLTKSDEGSARSPFRAASRRARCPNAPPPGNHLHQAIRVTHLICIHPAARISGSKFFGRSGFVLE